MTALPRNWKPCLRKRRTPDVLPIANCSLLACRWMIGRRAGRQSRRHAKAGRPAATAALGGAMRPMLHPMLLPHANPVQVPVKGTARADRRFRPTVLHARAIPAPAYRAWTPVFLTIRLSSRRDPPGRGGPGGSSVSTAPSVELFGLRPRPLEYSRRCKPPDRPRSPSSAPPVW